MRSLRNLLRGQRFYGASALVGILALNLIVCRRMFSIEYPRWLESIEAVYPAIASWILRHWPDLGWMPDWYCGIPFQNSYPPVLPATTAALSAVLRLSTGHAYHVLCGLIYCLLPLSLMVLVRRLAGSWRAAICAGAFLTTLSPCALLVPSIAHDVGGAFNDRRMHVLAYYGESPHLLALVLAPLAVLLLKRAIERRTPGAAFMAAALMTVTVLTNWLGAATLAILVVSLLFARRLSGWLAVLAISGAAYVLASPWIPPSTVQVINFNSRTLGGNFPFRWWQIPYALAVVVALVALDRLMRNASPGWRMAACWLLITASILLPASWTPLYLVPQPHRYQLPFDLAACCLAGMAFARLPWRRTAAAALILLCAIQIPRHVRFAGEFIVPIDIRTTTAYRTAEWCDREMQGRRVFVPGTTSYYLNIFTDTPQLAGGFEQGDPSWIQRVAMWTVYTGQNAGERDAAISALWLKAYRVRAVQTGGPASGEPSHAYRNWRKFDGMFPVLWSDGDDRMYGVPAACDSLASVVRREELVRRVPEHGLDVEELGRYVAALDRGNCAPAEWIGPGRMHVAADLREGEVISLGITHHRGWHAEHAVRLSADALGLMAIEPSAPGHTEIELIYDGGAEMRTAVLAQRALLALFLLAALFYRRFAGFFPGKP